MNTTPYNSIEEKKKDDQTDWFYLTVRNTNRDRQIEASRYYHLMEIADTFTNADELAYFVAEVAANWCNRYHGGIVDAYWDFTGALGKLLETSCDPAYPNEKE